MPDRCTRTDLDRAIAAARKAARDNYRLNPKIDVFEVRLRMMRDRAWCISIALTGALSDRGLDAMYFDRDGQVVGVRERGQDRCLPGVDPNGDGVLRVLVSKAEATRRYKWAQWMDYSHRKHVWEHSPVKAPRDKPARPPENTDEERKMADDVFRTLAQAKRAALRELQDRGEL